MPGTKQLVSSENQLALLQVFMLSQAETLSCSMAGQRSRALAEAVHAAEHTCKSLRWTFLLQVLTECLISAGMPKAVAQALMKFSAALDIGANSSSENDIFNLLKNPLDAAQLCGLFRRTKSETLGRNAEEFGLLK